MNGPTILIASEDQNVVQLLTEALLKEGIQATNFKSEEEIVKKVMDPGISLLLLDMVIPDGNGLEVCKKIRPNVSIPILLLSARNRELDRIIGLEVGADDYILKPFSVNELVARIKAHLRRENRYVCLNKTIQTSDLVINKDTYEVYHENQKISLTTKEFEILFYMVQNKNRVLSREQIYDAIWGQFGYGDINTITVHIKNLRSKLALKNQSIKTVWGVGYKFVG
ncbi:response regulator transcription factor [Brevibacillus nitrificans]|nr:response regulator transcription factor [Brevibacillus nitrificans]